MELRVVQDWLMSEFNIEITKSFTITKDDLVKSEKVSYTIKM